MEALFGFVQLALMAAFSVIWVTVLVPVLRSLLGDKITARTTTPQSLDVPPSL